MGTLRRSEVAAQLRTLAVGAGGVLLLGVGHEADTSLHLPELIAKVPYGIPRHCTVMRHGWRVRVDYVESDHCCQRFALADDWLRATGLQAEGPVGQGTSRYQKRNGPEPGIIPGERI